MAFNPNDKDVNEGIVYGLDSEAYHAGPGISKSGLWTIYTKTPAHYRFEERAEKNQNALDLGSATHLALLQPEEFEAKVFLGPENRMGNKWKDALLEAEHRAGPSAIVLTTKDYERCQRIRDSGELCATLVEARRGAIIEASGYATDPATGALCRVRPDCYNPELGIIADLKTARDGGRRGFMNAVAEYGYHMQEAFYSDVWNRVLDFENLKGADQTVEAFIFIVIESAAPFQVSAYELAPSAVEEGRQAYQRALVQYATCKERERLGMPERQAWPGYPEEPEPLDLPYWAYKLTPRPEAE